MDKHTDTAEYWKSKFIQQNKDLDCELMDPNGTIWDHAKKLQAENERLREALESIKREATDIEEDIQRSMLRIGKIVFKALERKQP